MKHRWKKVVNKPTIEGRSLEMDLATDAKFEKWDHIVQHNILETGTQREKDEAASMLHDPTIYLYAFFKDDNGKPFKLYSYQDLIINDDSDRIIFAAANQIGKSITLCVKALLFMLNNPGTTTLMVSKTLPQSKDLLRQIKRFLNNCTVDYREEIGDSDTKTEISIRHTDENGKDLGESRIICVPATEAALGYAVDLLLIDELAFYEDGEYFYRQIAQPRTYTTKGQIVVFSNPNGQQGIFWDLWNDKYFSKYRFTFLDKPDNTLAEYERICDGLTQDKIDSTLMAIFTDPEGGFMSYLERKAMQEERPNSLPSNVRGPLYIFFDFAKSLDSTVRVIGCPVGEGPEGVYVYEMKEYKRGTPYTDILDDLDRLIKNIGNKNFAMIGWDNTGVGAGIEDFIMRLQYLGIQCTPVDFSLVNKSRIYTMFKLLVERNLKSIGGSPRQGIKVPFVKECDLQLAKLRFTRSERGYLKVHHENERDKDDFPDAIAGLCSLIVQPDVAPITATIIGGDDEGTVEPVSEEDEEKTFGTPLGVC